MIWMKPNSNLAISALSLVSSRNSTFARQAASAIAPSIEPSLTEPNSLLGTPAELKPWLRWQTTWLELMNRSGRGLRPSSPASGIVNLIDPATTATIRCSVSG